MRSRWAPAVFGAALALGLGSASAAPTQVTLGNAAPGFADGDTPPTVDLAAAQAGQPAPFASGIGNDVIGPDFASSWLFSYAAPPDPIVAASLTLGLADHDSAASGEQLAHFEVEGIDLASALSAALESHGGSDSEYNVYSVALPSSLFGQLEDGATFVELGLQGPGLLTPLFPLPGPNPPMESANNGAHLVFATLAFETVPEPNVASLAAGAVLGVLALRRRARR